VSDSEKSATPESAAGGPGLDFIREAVAEDLKSGRYAYVRTVPYTHLRAHET